MVKSAEDYASGLKRFLQKKYSLVNNKEESFDISELNQPQINIGTDSGIKGSCKNKGLEFYAGFLLQKAETRLRFFFQLSFPKESALAKKLEEEFKGQNSARLDSVSKNLGKTTIRYNPSEKNNIFSVYCHVQNPKHIKANDLYQDLLTYFIKEPVALASR